MCYNTIIACKKCKSVPSDYKNTIWEESPNAKNRNGTAHALEEKQAQEAFDYRGGTSGRKNMADERIWSAMLCQNRLCQLWFQFPDGIAFQKQIWTQTVWSLGWNCMSVIKSMRRIRCWFLTKFKKVPRALASLKYFCENAPQYHIVCACSLLGIALHEGTSFPVGKVDFLKLYPLSLQEFLMATGKGRFCRTLGNRRFCDDNRL